MTDNRREAIERLIVAVEKRGLLLTFLPSDLEEQWGKIIKADRGSLDAAKELHEAVLPGWQWSKTSLGTVRVYQVGGRWNGSTDNTKSNTARAWLLAILRALASEEGGPA